jgi:hypothetical protein
MSVLADKGSESGHLRVKNTFVHAEPIIHRVDFDVDATSLFRRQESESALFNRGLTRTSVARKAFVAARLMSSDEPENEIMKRCGAKVQGHSVTAETMDECVVGSLDSDGSESDQSSETEWEPLDAVMQSENHTHSVNSLEQLRNSTEQWDLPEQPEDLVMQISAGPAALDDFCRQTTEQCWPTHFDPFMQASVMSAASGDLCTQTVEQPWPTYCNFGSITPEHVGQPAAVNQHQLPEALQPCVESLTPTMWPTTPTETWFVGGTDAVFGGHCVSEPSMVKRRRNKRQFNKWSLVSLAEQAQQQQKDDQQSQTRLQHDQCKRLHGIQHAQKHDRIRKPTALVVETKKLQSCGSKFCPYCGNEILPHFKCCPFCGSSQPVAAHQIASHEECQNK